MNIGNQAVRFRDVRKITDPGLMKNDQKVSSDAAQDLKKSAAVNQTGGAESSSSASSANIMDSVGLSREMMAKLKKETKN
ncbi:MAG: hypothetical protein N2578_08410 [Bdellovibrionaceae bacterium]|nr:hypothetical protein [Pseudobdellovibrionaceae bacterium]